MTTLICTLPNALQQVLGSFKWELFDHPLVSPDLPHSDHLFPNMKKMASITAFENDRELKDSVNTWLKSEVEEFFDKGIRELITDIRCA